ncbi:sodium:calcium antiporter [Blautia schinkii]|nr:sodium:calcium antiporter [Blautia schinkii]
MSIAFSVLMFCLGLFFLVFGSNLFVDSAVKAAEHFRLPEVVIGATVLSFGTTLPELLFSSAAAMHDATDMALGNAFGSIICNVGFIGGVMLLLSPTILKKENVRNIKTGYLWLVTSCCVFLLSGVLFGGIPRMVSVLLLMLCVFYVRESLSEKNQQQQEIVEGASFSAPIPPFSAMDFVQLALEAALLYIGAEFLIKYGQRLARAMGWPEVLISVTFVALGTSLPELITAITSVKKKHTALSLGNIIGASILNLVLVGGFSGLIRPLPFHGNVMPVDFPFILLLSGILCIPSILTHKASRIQGALLLLGYGGYLYLLFC